MHINQMQSIAKLFFRYSLSLSTDIIIIIPYDTKIFKYYRKGLYMKVCTGRRRPNYPVM